MKRNLILTKSGKSWTETCGYADLITPAEVVAKVNAHDVLTAAVAAALCGSPTDPKWSSVTDQLRDALLTAGQVTPVKPVRPSRVRFGWNGGMPLCSSCDPMTYCGKHDPKPDRCSACGATKGGAK